MNNNRHKLTKADRQKGFRNAVWSLQVRYNVDFNQAVQWLLRKGRGLRWNESNERR